MSPRGVEDPELEVLLRHQPQRIRTLTYQACALIQRCVPSSVQRVRLGWKLVGFSAPHYFAFVAPQEDVVKVGFEWGVLLPDPVGILTGTGTQVRYVPVVDGTELRNPALAHLIELAAQQRPPRRKR
ncbi:MAG: hypothetical protein AB2A00_11530 [Myxococcota bacterium]